jgi:hypothetical protein
MLWSKEVVDEGKQMLSSKSAPLTVWRKFERYMTRNKMSYSARKVHARICMQTETVARACICIRAWVCCLPWRAKAKHETRQTRTRARMHIHARATLYRMFLVHPQNREETMLNAFDMQANGKKIKAIGADRRKLIDAVAQEIAPSGPERVRTE